MTEANPYAALKLAHRCKSVVLSTSHLTDAERSLLASPKAQGDDRLTWTPYEYGYVVFTEPDELAESEDGPALANLCYLLREARAQHIDVILFDFDAEPVPGLPQFAQDNASAE